MGGIFWESQAQKELKLKDIEINNLKNDNYELNQKLNESNQKINDKDILLAISFTVIFVIIIIFFVYYKYSKSEASKKSKEFKELQRTVIEEGTPGGKSKVSFLSEKIYKMS